MVCSFMLHAVGFPMVSAVQNLLHALLFQTHSVQACNELVNPALHNL